MASGGKFIAAVVLLAAAFNIEGAAAASPAAKAPMAATVPVATSTTEAEVEAAAEPQCVRVKGAEACVGPDDSDRPGITIEDTANDKRHPAVEYYLNGYLGTMYVIHNMAGNGEVRGSTEIGSLVVYRAAIYSGDHRIKAGRWTIARNVTKYPVKRETRVTPGAVQSRTELCTSTQNAASVCFADGKDKKSVVFACDIKADKYQARAEYFIGGDPTTRFEIHQLAGGNTCGKAEHGNRAISMYRASLFDQENLVTTRLYKYN